MGCVDEYTAEVRNLRNHKRETDRYSFTFTHVDGASSFTAGIDYVYMQPSQ